MTVFRGSLRAGYRAGDRRSIFENDDLQVLVDAKAFEIRHWRDGHTFLLCRIEPEDALAIAKEIIERMGKN